MHMQELGRSQGDKPFGDSYVSACSVDISNGVLEAASKKKAAFKKKAVSTERTDLTIHPKASAEATNLVGNVRWV